MNVFDLTAHQLDVLRTLGSVVGGLGGLAGGVAAVFSILARYWAKQAAHQTRREEFVDGTLHTLDVAEMSSNTMHATQEIRDLFPREHGRRRMPTTEIPLLGEEYGNDSYNQ